ncbi:uncharacterized protein LOC117241588 [Bombus vosnesenskii]|uniref:Uncharacterized protein LOC117239465 n=1 Tax=Bombus vosnesenskii TaxID=207650 RepID=A0A6J3L8J1_9HYME|nr:uncharacterized protein LOC117239465 [Bombus vosnesenskii]XP_033363347.1 uncharacterized protein LOC117241588 [Bombus vosnesenskii]
MFAESFPSEVPIQTSLRKRKRDSEEPMGDSGRPIKRMRPCDKPQVSEWLEELLNIGAEAVSKLSFDDLVTFDESFFDAETVVLEWEPPLVEIVDTDRCVKVRFANEIPGEIWRHIFVTMLLGEREFPLLCVIGVCVSSANFVLELLATILI